MTSRFALALAGSVLCLALPACRGFKAEAPEGFAAFDDWTRFRAVSPEGVLYRVRSEKNDPEATLPFWREALKKRMLDAGYTLVTDGEAKAGAEAGYLLEVAAPVGQEDYTYLVAVFVRGSRLTIVEASGEVSKFRGRRAAVVAAIGKIAL